VLGAEGQHGGGGAPAAAAEELSFFRPTRRSIVCTVTGPRYPSWLSVPSWLPTAGRGRGRAGRRWCRGRRRTVPGAGQLLRVRGDDEVVGTEPVRVGALSAEWLSTEVSAPSATASLTRDARPPSPGQGDPRARSHTEACSGSQTVIPAQSSGAEAAGSRPRGGGRRTGRGRRTRGSKPPRDGPIRRGGRCRRRSASELVAEVLLPGPAHGARAARIDDVADRHGSPTPNPVTSRPTRHHAGELVARHQERAPGMGPDGVQVGVADAAVVDPHATSSGRGSRRSRGTVVAPWRDRFARHPSVLRMANPPYNSDKQTIRSIRR